MSHATLSQLAHKALRDAGYAPAEMKKPGFIVAAERDGRITISHSPTYDLEHTQVYQVILKEQTPLRINLVPISVEMYQLSVQEPIG
jgi:hypothetical protein